MKKYSFLLGFLVTILLTTSVLAGPFTDVPAQHWAYGAVNKLVAAGIAEGYPDGTFKGKNNLTRYEIAVIVSRILNKIEMEREILADDIAAAANNLSKAQAQDVTAIVKAMLAKNQVGPVEAPKNLTDQQVEEVVNLIEALTFEFKAELKMLGQEIDGIYADVDAVEARVTALENATPTVSFGGKFSVDLIDQYVEGDLIQKEYIDIDGDGLYDQGEEDTDDSYVYTDPWDDDSDEIEVDYEQSDGEVKQTLDLQANIVKDGLTATVKLDVHEDDDVEDVLVLDKAELIVENETLKGVYNEENIVDIADYAYSQAEFNGVVVDWKQFGLETFFGTIEYDVAGTKDLDNGHELYDDYDSITGQYKDLIEDSEDFYVMGAKKKFALDSLDLGVNVSSRRARNEYFTGECGTVVKVEDMNQNILGFDVQAQLGEIDGQLDFAHSMPELDGADNGSLIRFAVSTGLPFADLEFNYKNRDEHFDPISEDDVVFDLDDDDYDKFTTGLGKKDMTGWNFKVTEQIIDLLEASFFYANIEEVGDETSKLALKGKMPILMDGLTLTGEYAIKDPVETDVEENTTKVDLKYEAEYVTAGVGYKNVTDKKFTADKDVVTVKYDVNVVDYPIYQDLVVRAGFNFEDIGEDEDEESSEYNVGFGYSLGAAQLNYDYTYKEVEGDTADQGNYTTNRAGLVYTITDSVDFKAAYQVLELNDIVGELYKAEEYKVRTAKAGVSIAF